MEEARKAMYVAERKIAEKDYHGAKRSLNKAQYSYPNLDGLKQVSAMIDVYISASFKKGGESDWYAILGVDPLADDETLKKHYKKLALLLHPDKNKFHGAEGAFNLVSDALCLLSDKAERFGYDQRRKRRMKPLVSERQTKPASSTPAAAERSKKRKDFCDAAREFSRRFDERQAYQKKKKTAAAAEEQTRKFHEEVREIGKVFYALRSDFLRRFGERLMQQGCDDDQNRKQSRQEYPKKKKETEASPQTSQSDDNSAQKQTQERLKRWLDESRVRLSAAILDAATKESAENAYERKRKEYDNQKTSDASSSSSTPSDDSAKAQAQERVQRWLEQSRERLSQAILAAATKESAEKAHEQKRKQYYNQKTSDASSSSSTPSDDSAKAQAQAQERVQRWLEESRERLSQAIQAAAAKESANKVEMLLKRPVTRARENANSTSEVESLYKNWMKTGNENCSFETGSYFQRWGRTYAM